MGATLSVVGSLPRQLLLFNNVHESQGVGNEDALSMSLSLSSSLSMPTHSLTHSLTHLQGAHLVDIIPPQERCMVHPSILYDGLCIASYLHTR